ncbi:hypothetical protein Dsin_026071 [Dipteronia sinensis]|uniref:WRC domain-containing protein n=1 Tax=Dipteronia sinensis TaxID=43782 RepID=A0AAE0DXR9_9ROSI|nr:hypothetical protein Dsin_026071 [Dipteronia sinensis]
MRIRKNAKLSSILLSASSCSSHASTPETLQTHVCQLNQSPWDVISFSQESFQFEGEDSFTGNGSFGDSIGAVESSVASMMDGEDHKAVMFKVDDMVIEEDNDVEELDGMLDDDEDDNSHLQIENEDKPLYCIKTHCRNEPRNGHNLCDHHAAKTCISNSSKKADKGISVGTTSGRRGRARAKKGSSSASNPYEFYYYSGFGPLWGKRRGGDRVNQGKKLLEENNSYPDVKTSLSSSSLIDNGGLDYVDDFEDDEDDEENGDTGKIKRMRKPVKARSLKSLM